MAEKIVIKGARVNNLKNISLEIPKNKLVVLTGLSGSGKSSLAFDTIYAESSRRFLESFSFFAKQFLELYERPDVEEISGLVPAIAIKQQSIAENPRSTVATATEIADYLRVLFARLGRPFCFDCQKEMKKFSLKEIIEKIFLLLQKEPLNIYAPLNTKNFNENDLAIRLTRSGFEQIKINGHSASVLDLANTPLNLKEDKIEVLIGTYSPQDLIENRENLRLSILTGLEIGDKKIFVEGINSHEQFIFSEEYTCPQCGKIGKPLEPHDFSFNSPHGACPVCRGLGVLEKIDPELVIPNKKLSIAQGAIKPWVRLTMGQSKIFRLLSLVSKKYKFSLNTPVAKLKPEHLNIVLYGSPEEFLLDGEKLVYLGVVHDLEKKYRETDSEYLRQELKNFMREEKCPACQGKRFKKETLAIKIFGKNIADFFALSVDDASVYFREELINLQKQKNNLLSVLEKEIAKTIFSEILNRLKNLQKTGLGYLTLDRSLPSLSGGETERLRLAAQLSSRLSGVLYILDEPTTGLHERDTEKLINILKEIIALGNSVIVVEHDYQFMKSADWLIDLGPGAGEKGGEIVAQGPLKKIIQQKKSLTGKYLSSKKFFLDLLKEARSERKYFKAEKYLEIKGAKANNLKNLDVRIPLKQFVCVTGVSGSGKSTLVMDILAKALLRKFYQAKDLPKEHKEIIGVEEIDKVIVVDQEPIGRTPRSNPATYTGIFTLIRDFFANLPESKMKGFNLGTFSFNVKGGRCEVCGGEGYLRVPMQFLPDTFIECYECHGQRYRQEVLDIHWQGKNIADVLNMSVSEAIKFFQHIPLLAEKLKVLEEVGLGYLKLGQGAPTLSGGEAQRVKLATELSRRATGRTLYILDEPTTGLHFEDIKNLLKILHQLVAKGNSVLVIEHHPLVIASADWIIDLGPEGGEKGGEIVALGTPQNLMQNKKSYTGQYLKKFFKD